MNLEESDAFVEEMERTDKKKKNVLTIIGVCGLVIVFLIFLIMYLTAEDAKRFKLYIDGNKIQNYSSIIFNKNYNQEKAEPDYYINIEQLAKYLGYSYQNGEYKSYTEDPKSCYISTPYEIVSMKSDSNGFTKYILDINSDQEESEDENKDEEDSNKIKIIVKSKNQTQKTFHLDNPVQYIEKDKYFNVKEGLYVSINEIANIFNVQLDMSEKNRVRITSLESLINNYATRIATNYKYKTISNTYENFTAMAAGMLVVGDGENYGVLSLETGEEIISLKYEDIVYMQNTEEFQVSAEGSVGVVSKKGKTIIKPTEYDNISVLDEKKKIYLAEKNDKYGVVNHDGDTIIFCEYDSIGIPNSDAYAKEGIRNYNLLFDKCIPVELDGKFGLMDIEGNEILKIVYDAFGTAEIENNVVEEEKEISNEPTNSTSKNNKTRNTGDNILIIPESKGINGIIVKSNDLYGIFDAEVQHLITPCVFSKITLKTVSGEPKYTLEYEGTNIDLDYYLTNNKLISIEKPIAKDEEKNESEDSEEIGDTESDNQDNEQLEEQTQDEIVEEESEDESQE